MLEQSAQNIPESSTDIRKGGWQPDGSYLLIDKFEEYLDGKTVEQLLAANPEMQNQEPDADSNPPS
jgi:hypothetical protein